MIPYGSRFLFIICFDHDRKQFRGILRLARKLKNGFKKEKRFYPFSWDGNRLNLSRRRKLRRVLISGHGATSAARFSGLSRALTPRDLRLPKQARLFLMGCSQGKKEHRRSWAEGTGLPESRILGSDDDTESALSTCLLLNLLENGPESIDRWFPAWLASNAYLRPHFPMIRKLYRECGRDPLKTLSELSRRIDLTPAAGFLAVCRKYPEYLFDLLE